MNSKNIHLKIINPLEYLPKVKELLHQLSPDKQEEYIVQTLHKMTTIKNYLCFGLYENEDLLGISSGWISTRIYAGKHLELDNVIVNQNLQSKGFGKIFFNKIEEWAAQNEYKTLGLNTYVSNARSHKFYFNQGYHILGFHFQKQL